MTQFNDKYCTVSGPQNPDKLHPGVTHPAAKKFFQKLPNCLKFKIGYKCASNDGKEDTTIPVVNCNNF